MSENQAMTMTDVARFASPARHDASRQAAPARSGDAGAAGLYAAPAKRRGAWFFFLLIGAAVYGGWLFQGEEYLTAESGIGYALGIVGGTMMLLLLLYPVRKKLRFVRGLGPTKYWFRAHMVFGILGPALILFHANFNMGSLNSNVALTAMLLVAASGLVGRYFYSKIHYGLYGRRANLVELRQMSEANSGLLGAVYSFAPKLQDRLRAFETMALAPPRGLLHSAGRIVTMGFRTRWTRLAAFWSLRRALKAQAEDAGWSARERRRQRMAARRHVSIYLATARKVAEFTFFERLFSLWHVLHLPLFFVLVIASVVHVVAVHMY